MVSSPWSALGRAIVVGRIQPLELFPRHLPTDQAGDPQDRRVDPGPRLSIAIAIAVVVGCRRLSVVGRAIVVLDHRHPSSKKIPVGSQSWALGHARSMTIYQSYKSIKSSRGGEK